MNGDEEGWWKEVDHAFQWEVCDIVEILRSSQVTV